MSSTTKTLAQLEKIAKSKEGVYEQALAKPTGRGGKLAKRDLIKYIGQYNLKQKFGNLEDIPTCLKFKLAYESPALAFQYKLLKPEEQKAIWESDNWILTEKENGVRGWIIYHPKEGDFLYSRGISDVDFLPVEYQQNLLHRIPKNACDLMVIDCEIKATNPKIKTYLRDAKGVETETELQAVSALLSMNSADSLEIQRTQALDEPLLEFKLIDVLYWKKTNLINAPYRERRKVFDEVVTTVKSFGVNIKRINRCEDSANKKAFHEGILERGGEGTVAVNLDAKYNPTPNRHRDEWVKIKRSVAQTSVQERLSDTLDGWISGFELASENKGWAGLIGAFKISTFLQTKDGEEVEHEIARVASIPLSMRQEATVEKDGVISMNPDFYDRVVELDGQAISARARRLSHARILRYREDKSKYECTISEDFLDSQIL